MGRHRDIETIITEVLEPMFDDIMNGNYKLEDATKDIGTHRIVFRISFFPTDALKRGNQFKLN